MNESDVKRKIVESIHKEQGYARRIEDQFSVGMPDLVLIPLHCPVVWAEVKMVSGRQFGPTMRQLVELMRLKRPPHSIPIMIGYKEGVHYISPPRKAVSLYECYKQEPRESIGDLIRRALSHM